MNAVLIRAGAPFTARDRREGAKVVRVVTGAGEHILLSPLSEVSLLRRRKPATATVALLSQVGVRVKCSDDDPLEVLQIPERGDSIRHVLKPGESMTFEGHGTALKISV